MGAALNWTTGGAIPRRGAREETRYAFARCAHPAATLIAAGSPLLAILVVLSLALLRL